MDRRWSYTGGPDGWWIRRDGVKAWCRRGETPAQAMARIGRERPMRRGLGSLGRLPDLTEET